MTNKSMMIAIHQDVWHPPRSRLP